MESAISVCLEGRESSGVFWREPRLVLEREREREITIRGKRLIKIKRRRAN